MHLFLLILIGLLGSASCVVGIRQMLQGKYLPSTFSRVVWLLLAINSFAGVVFSHSTQASILLAAILLLGSVAVCLVSFWKGTRTMGRLEYVCVALLVVSGLLWIVIDAPLINLGIGLLAHFIGAAPTYKKVWLDPKSESVGFWSLFFLASLLSVLASPGSSIKDVIFPIYFTLFDGSLFVLSLRGRLG